MMEGTCFLYWFYASSFFTLILLVKMVEMLNRVVGYGYPPEFKFSKVVGMVSSLKEATRLENLSIFLCPHYSFMKQSVLWRK